jgi:hypothetical protein
MELKHTVISVEIMPFVEDPACYDSSGYITRQPDGPTDWTSGFFVSLRMEGGGLKLVATVPHQEDADFVAEAYAKRHGVEVEAQPWKK